LVFVFFCFFRSSPHSFCPPVPPTPLSIGSKCLFTVAFSSIGEELIPPPLFWAFPPVQFPWPTFFTVLRTEMLCNPAFVGALFHVVYLHSQICSLRVKCHDYFTRTPHKWDRFLMCHSTHVVFLPRCPCVSYPLAHVVCG